MQQFTLLASFFIFGFCIEPGSTTIIHAHHLLLNQIPNAHHQQQQPPPVVVAQKLPAIQTNQTLRAVKEGILGFSKMLGEKDASHAGLTLLKTTITFVGIFVPQWAPIGNVLVALLDLTNPSDPSAELIAIQKLHKAMEKRFDRLEQKIDQLEKNIRLILLQNTYLQTYLMQLKNQKTGFYYLTTTKSENQLDYIANAKIFIADCMAPYRPHQLLDHLNTMISETCLSPMDITQPSNVTGNEDLCFLSAIYDKYEQKWSPLLKAAHAIRFDVLSILPIALSCIHMNYFRDNPTKEQLIRRINNTVIDIIENMYTWINGTLADAFPSAFKPGVSMLLSEYGFVEDFNYYYEAKHSHDAFARKLKADCDEHGLPHVENQVHFFFNGPVRGRNRQFKVYSLHDEKFFTVNDAGYTATVIPALVLENVTAPKLIAGNYFASQSEIATYFTTQAKSGPYADFDNLDHTIESILYFDKSLNRMSDYIRAIILVTESWYSDTSWVTLDDNIPPIGIAMANYAANDDALLVQKPYISTQLCDKKYNNRILGDYIFFCSHLSFFF